MAILSWVSQRALWLRRISSMPVSTSVGAEVPGKPRKHHGGQSFWRRYSCAQGFASSCFPVLKTCRVVWPWKRSFGHGWGGWYQWWISFTTSGFSVKSMARAYWWLPLMRASFRVHVRLADYAPSGEVLGHRGNVAKLNAVVYSSTEQVLDRSSTWSLHDLGGW